MTFAALWKTLKMLLAKRIDAKEESVTKRVVLDV